MTRYFIRRVLLIIPTLFAIIAINFGIVQLAPGGPAEAIIVKLHQPGSTPGNSLYRGGENLDAATTTRLNAEFGFNQPPLTRFLHMLRGYLTFNLGDSLSSGAPVASLIWQRLPVSLSLGLWSTLIVYLISIPLGILKAACNGSTFDTATGTIIAAGYAIPGFLLAILLITILGQGGILPLFPLRDLTSPGATAWPLPARIADYAWHLVLPTIAITAGGFATLTLLTKNAILEETQKLYVTTARAKGASEPRILLRHILPNAAILLTATLPAAFTTILFTSALLVEIIFSLNGLGLLGFNAILARDYPVMFGTLYIYTIIALTLRLLGDFLYALLDPRIDFDSRK